MQRPTLMSPAAATAAGALFPVEEAWVQASARTGASSSSRGVMATDYARDQRVFILFQSLTAAGRDGYLPRLPPPDSARCTMNRPLLNRRQFTLGAGAAVALVARRGWAAKSEAINVG